MMAKPKKNKPWYKLKASAETVTLILYGYIGEWDESAERWRSELLAHGSKDLHVHFQTYGGEVDEGMGIYAAFKDYQGHITGIVDTVCASIASQALMACDKRLIRPTARLMIHQCEGWASGKASEMRARADEAEIINDQMMKTFAEVSGQPLETILEDTKDADLWLGAEQAIEYGLCDELYEGPDHALQACGELIEGDDHSPRRNALKAALAQGVNIPSEPDALTAQDPATQNEEPNNPAHQSKPKLEAGTNDMTFEEYLAKEKARKSSLKALFKNHPKHKVLQARCVDDPECTLEMAQNKLLAACEQQPEGEGNSNTPTVGGEQQTKLTANAAQAHLHNFFGAKLKACAWDENNPYRQMSSTEALRAHAVAMGDSNAMQLPKKKLVAQAFNNSTHSLGVILETHIGALIINEVANLESWHTPLVTRQPMQFGTNDVLVMNDLGKPGVKTEGGKFTQVKLTATDETAVLSTLGYEIKVTRELIMSDKFDFISKQVEKAVRNCAQVPANTLIELLKTNPALSDNKKLFSKASGNEFDGELNANSIATMSGGMADTLTSTGQPLHLKPELMLMSNTRAKTARAIIKAETIKDEPNEAFEAFEKVQGLADLAKGDVAFAFAHNDHVSFVEGYHEDAEGVQVETLDQWASDGATVRVFIDSVVKAVDRKGVQKLNITVPVKA